jgi:hypothetical protein
MNKLYVFLLGLFVDAYLLLRSVKYIWLLVYEHAAIESPSASMDGEG